MPFTIHYPLSTIRYQLYTINYPLFGRVLEPVAKKLAKRQYFGLKGNILQQFNII